MSAGAKKTVKFPYKAIPTARLEKWKKASQDAEELAKQIEQANTALVGKRAVCTFILNELATEFDIGPTDQVNLETGEITKGKA